MGTILLAVVTGVAVLLIGNLPWAGFGPVTGLGARGFASPHAVPWGIVPMAIYLWVYWRFLAGGWAIEGQAERRINLRAKPLAVRSWLAALGAGVVGFGALLALLALAARLVALPVSPPIVVAPGKPVVAIILLLVMSSIVAGVTEEAAFRGYMQSMVERRYGVVVAILVNGVLFGLLHFGNHPDDILVMLPYYVAVAAVYGGLTWAANSILPALVLHVLGDVAVLIRWWATGLAEWQLTSVVPPLVWATGIDRSFAVTAGLAAMLGIATWWLVRRVRKLVLSEQLGGPLDANR